ncbi:MAG: Hydrolase or acyltransferase [Candidatus Tokpelaia hoelldobleri]|uniref:Hydrolase or acyltransferase n=1 Tax=Candidatus Tokpelaia hoelldobleri TaxID=1902579 RepID=A0A1U9JV05_9HYPH|nr:MAG: Hydrolase or acyltransferase [Candidatus Tokpelaia hoelldoblerii]
MGAETVQFFEHDGFKLGYREEGQGEPVLLVHGFASSSQVNWLSPGWFRTLAEAGYRVIAIDDRGHGHSDKSYELADYTPEKMADDATALLDHLGIGRAHVMGYSMGARIAAFMALRVPDRVHTLVFGGLGIGMVTGAGHWEPVREALLAEDAAAIDNPRGQMFRKFADNTKSDRRALAACVIASKKELTEDEVRRINQPALVAVGERDDIAGAPQPLVALLPQGEALVIPGRDHMLSVGDKVYKKAVVEFLQRHPFNPS